MSIFDGKRIDRVNPCGGIVIGQPKWYEIHFTGGMLVVQNSKDAELIDKITKEAKHLKLCGDDACNYLRYRLMEEGW